MLQGSCFSCHHIKNTRSIILLVLKLRRVFLVANKSKFLTEALTRLKTTCSNNCRNPMPCLQTFPLPTNNSLIGFIVPGPTLFHSLLIHLMACTHMPVCHGTILPLEGMASLQQWKFYGLLPRLQKMPCCFWHICRQRNWFPLKMRNQEKFYTKQEAVKWLTQQKYRLKNIMGQ